MHQPMPDGIFREGLDHHGGYKDVLLIYLFVHRDRKGEAVVKNGASPSAGNFPGIPGSRKGGEMSLSIGECYPDHLGKLLDSGRLSSAHCPGSSLYTIQGVKMKMGVHLRLQSESCASASCWLIGRQLSLLDLK